MTYKSPEIFEYAKKLREEGLIIEVFNLVNDGLGGNEIKRKLAEKYNTNIKKMSKIITDSLYEYCNNLRKKISSNKEIYKYISDTYFNGHMPDFIRARLYKIGIKHSPVHKINKGDKFGYLTVIEEVEPIIHGKKTYRAIKCKCVCGNIITTTLKSLIKGSTKSCGCLQKEIVKQIGYNNKKHGLTKSRFYGIRININSRCNNKKTINYDIYGGRGIKCLWNSFEEFKNDMYESYLEHIKKYGEKNTTIDRIDLNGHYCKENCRWATRKEQANNRRTCNYITYNGIKKNITQRADFFGITYNKLKRKLNKGYSFAYLYNYFLYNEKKG